MSVPLDNPLSPEKIDLGYKLFFDKRLSANNSISCSTCHQPNRGWTDNRQIARGIFNRRGTRNSPTIINVAYAQSLFRDGRATSLEAQVLIPLTSLTELGNGSIQSVIDRLNTIPYYRSAFKDAFPESQNPLSAINLAKAIASFERTILSFNTPYDQYSSGDITALSIQQIRGLQLFKKHCTICHVEPLLTDNLFHNTLTSQNENEQGRFIITQNPNDFKSFRTPQLREIGRTNPYFHSGRAKKLGNVINHYNTTRSLNLSLQEQTDLEDFLLNGLLSPDVPNLPEPNLP